MRIFLPQNCQWPRIVGLHDSAAADIIVENYAAESTDDFAVALIPDPTARTNGRIYEVTGDDWWQLEQIANPVFFQRRPIDGIDGEIFGFFRETACSTQADNTASKGESAPRPSHTWPEYGVHALTSARYAKKYDVCLTIPGYAKGINTMPRIHNRYGEQLNDAVRAVADAEFAGDYIKNNTRRTVGTLLLVLNPTPDRDIPLEQTIFQPAVVNVMVHNETKLCVVEIWAPCLLAPAARLLSYYCADQLQVWHEGLIKPLTTVIAAMGITMYGDKRSVVFAYDHLEHDELLNLLVNEETPMGRIMGSQFEAYAATNLAQYDTAKVYASETTMIEVAKTCPFDVMARIQTQAIELFFVEMLLLQDAAVSKMNQTVKDMVVFERNTPYASDTKKVINDMVIDMSHAVNFADYKQFYFPTVRVSAERISQAFGISTIEKKLAQNKDLLQQMIDSNKRKLDDKENKIKNVLLSVLSFVSGIGVLESILTGFLHSDFVAENSFMIAFGLMVIGTAIYVLILKVIKKNLQAKLRKERMREK